MLGLMLAVLPVLAGPVAAQGGLQGDNTYQSPQFGYTLTWGGDWTVRSRDVISNRGGFDTLTLRSPAGTLFVQGQGAGVTAAEAVQGRIRVEGGSEDVVAQDLDGEIPMVRMATGRSIVLIEGHTLEAEGGVVLIVLTAREKDLDAALASVREEVQFSGGQILGGQDTPEVEPEETPAVIEPTQEPAPVEEPTATPVDLTTPGGVLDGAYANSSYGYTLAFDPDLWTVIEGEASGAGDVLKLENVTGLLTIWSTADYGADPVACLDGESAYYGAESAAVTGWAPAVDANGDPIRHEADDSAWGVFTLTYTEPEVGTPQDLVDYIECRAISGANAVVIIHGAATPDRYNDHLDAVLDVADTLAFAEEGPSTPSAPLALLETGLSDSLYTSPSFGFTIDIPDQWVVVDAIIEVDDEQVLLANGISDVVIRATGAYTGDMAGCVDFAAASAPYDLEPATAADGTLFRGTDRNGAWGNFLYDDGAGVWVISCQPLVAGESVLIVAQDVPADELASQREARAELQQAIEVP